MQSRTGRPETETMTASRCTIFALFCALLASAQALALRIDPASVNVVQSGISGVRIVQKTPDTYPLFEFSPFVVYSETRVPGFSDPLGTGTDPLLKLFDGKVYHMDLLGDFNAYNPFDPKELEPTADSLHASALLNLMLYGVAIPDTEELVNYQLDLAKVPESKHSNDPRTSETSPMTLVGFGSVSELSRPIQLHWSHCPNFAFKRFLFQKQDKTAHVLRKLRPSHDCFVI